LEIGVGFSNLVWCCGINVH